VSIVPCVALTVIYGLAAARHILGGDNAEFVTIAKDGGVAHPPGYPLFVLWLRALSWIPGESPAHSAAIATALVGGVTVWLLTRAARAWGASEVGAALAAVIFGASSLASRLATAAEVFIPNAALVAAIVFVASPQSPIQGARRTVWLAGLAGLALANHHSAVLVAPIGIWGALRGLRESGVGNGTRTRQASRALRTIALSVFALGVGLSPYALMMLEAQRASSSSSALAWGDVRTFAGVFHHFVRADYGTMSLGASREAVSGMAHEMLFVKGLAEQTYVLPLFLAVFGAWVLVRKQSGEGRLPGVLLLLSFVLAGPLFVLQFNIAPGALGHLVTERFYLLPLLLLSLLAGVGITPLLDRLPRAHIYGPAVVAMALVGGGAFTLPSLAVEHAPTIENYLRDTLALAPERTILIGTGDHRIFGFAYVQRVLGERRDVTYVDARLLPHAWYRKQLAKHLVELDPSRVEDATTIDPRNLAALALESGRPVLITDLSLPTITQTFPTYPYGTTLRIMPVGSRIPSIPDVEDLNVALFERLHRSSAAPLDSWAQGARSDYERTWLLIADAYEKSGMLDAAARNRSRALAFAPLR
jgi:hypothetical protein